MAATSCDRGMRRKTELFPTLLTVIMSVTSSDTLLTHQQHSHLSVRNENPNESDADDEDITEDDLIQPGLVTLDLDADSDQYQPCAVTMPLQRPHVSARSAFFRCGPSLR